MNGFLTWIRSSLRGEVSTADLFARRGAGTAAYSLADAAACVGPGATSASRGAERVGLRERSRASSRRRERPRRGALALVVGTRVRVPARAGHRRADPCGPHIRPDIRRRAGADAARILAPR